MGAGFLSFVRTGSGIGFALDRLLLRTNSAPRGAGTGCSRADQWTGPRVNGRWCDQVGVRAAQVCKLGIYTGPGLPDIRCDGGYCSQPGYNGEYSTPRDQSLSPAGHSMT